MISSRFLLNTEWNRFHGLQKRSIVNGYITEEITGLQGCWIKCLPISQTANIIWGSWEQRHRWGGDKDFESIAFEFHAYTILAEGRAEGVGRMEAARNEQQTEDSVHFVFFQYRYFYFNQRKKDYLVVLGTGS